MILTSKNYGLYIRRLKIAIKRIFDFKIPPVPSIIFQIIKKYPQYNFILIPVFDADSFKIPKTWLRVSDDGYTRRINLFERSGWILWPTQQFRLSNFLGKDLSKIKKRHKTNEEATFQREFGFNLKEKNIYFYVSMISARELWLMYGLLHEIGHELFYHLPKNEWVKDNMYSEQEKCRSIVHVIDGGDYESITINPYNAIPTGRQIGWRPILFFNDKRFENLKQYKTGLMSCLVNKS